MALRQSILVVGGNGFLGSAVCRRALAKGYEVTSISSSGRPFATPKGHRPAWTDKVQWHAASALDPGSYKALLNNKTAVVHTLGILLEGGYKDSVRDGQALGLLSSLANNLSSSRNPLSPKEGGEYELINRDAALTVAQAYLASDTPPGSSRTFVYVSAEDIFRPWIPSRYINSKRQAETALAALFDKGRLVRDVYMRPGLMYHPHLRPLTTPLAVLMDISARIHEQPPLNLRDFLPASLLRSIGSQPSNYGSETQADSVFGSVANMLETPPIHVDQVAEAITTILDSRSEIRGPVDVKGMRDVINWDGRREERQDAEIKVWPVSPVTYSET